MSDDLTEVKMLLEQMGKLVAATHAAPVAPAPAPPQSNTGIDWKTIAGWAASLIASVAGGLILYNIKKSDEKIDGIVTKISTIESATPDNLKLRLGDLENARIKAEAERAARNKITDEKLDSLLDAVKSAGVDRYTSKDGAAMSARVGALEISQNNILIEQAAHKKDLIRYGEYFDEARNGK